MSGPVVLSVRDHELETRFAHLQNPIRDLAKNWDVDIASILETYLNELEGVTITFDGGKTTMNFVQAALLIQSSTSVYSRKVEFLYNLVHDMLQTLAKKKQPTTSGQDEEASSVEKESVDDFLTLDDIATNKNVDLRDGGNTKKKASLLPKTPPFFVPLDESEKGEMLFSPRGEQIGNKNDFKLGIATVHSIGMLRLEVDTEVASGAEGKITPSIPHDVPALITDDDDCGPSSPAPSMHSMGDCNEVINELPLGEPDDKLNHNENENEIENVDNQNEDDASRYNLRTREKKKDVLHEINRMEPSDSYEDTNKKDRPIKKGNVIRILDELEPKVTKKRKTKKEKLKSQESLMKLSSFCSVEYLSDQSKFVKKAMKIPTLVELNRLYWQEQKERQMNKLALKEIAPMDVIRMEEENNSDIDEGICDDYGGGDCGGDFGCDLPEPMQIDENKPEELLGPKEIDKLLCCTYEDLVRDHVDNYMISAQKYGQVTELSKRVQEWEERIMPVLEQEEEMEPFDIHDYGSKVLNRFSANNRKQTLPFRKVVEKQERRQVARYFLASLQLANSYNITISNHGQLESSVNTMELTLLSRVRHHEQLDEYVAPSLQAS